MGLFITQLEILKKETNAAILLIHHSGKEKSFERGSSALRGAADAMIKCEIEGDPMVGIRALSCDKMKDAEPFEKFNIKLEKVELGNGKSSLVPKLYAGEIPKANEKEKFHKNTNEALRILKEFGEKGAPHAEWLDAFRNKTGCSVSTFNRVIRDLKEHPSLTKIGESQGARYFYKASSPEELFSAKIGSK